MSDFFRFPHTPHIAWLGKGAPRDDKVLSPIEARDLLAGEVVIEEKLDGANLGISVSPEGEVRAQNRGQYLIAPHMGQFERLMDWLALRADVLFDVLGDRLILFGEWCAARHSLGYSQLPDWFLVFDVYDRETGRFWSTARRDALARQAGLPAVPKIFRGRIDIEELKMRVMSEPSRFRDGPLEGFVLRRESADWLEARAKLVRPDFTQAIDEHWRRRAIEWNRLDHGGPGK